MHKVFLKVLLMVSFIIVLTNKDQCMAADSRLERVKRISTFHVEAHIDGINKDTRQS